MPKIIVIREDIQISGIEKGPALLKAGPFLLKQAIIYSPALSPLYEIF